jgi:predicted PurR-regulated permease PerM
MPFDIKLDRTNLSKIILLCGALVTAIVLLKIFIYFFPSVLPIALPAALLAAPVYLQSRRFSISRYLIGLLVLCSLILLLLPGKIIVHSDPVQIRIASLPRNADAVRVLKTNAQHIQQTILAFTGELRGYFFMNQQALALAMVWVAIGWYWGSRLRSKALNKKSAKLFEPSVLLLYELPDRLASYLTNETLLVLCLTLGWGSSLTLLGFQHPIDLALLFGLAGLTPVIGMLWASGLTLFFIPWKQGALTPIIGLVITATVLWLLKYFFLNPRLQKSRPHPHPPVILACFLIGLVFAGYWGAFFGLPLYFICHWLSTYAQEAWRMIRLKS